MTTHGVAENVGISVEQWDKAVQAVKAAAKAPKDLSRLIPEEFREEQSHAFIDTLKHAGQKKKQFMRNYHLTVGYLLFHIESASLYAFEGYKSLNDMMEQIDLGFSTGWGYKLIRMYEKFVWELGLDNPENPYHEVFDEITSIDKLVAIVPYVNKENYTVWLDMVLKSDRDVIQTQTELAADRIEKEGAVQMKDLVPLLNPPPRKFEVKNKEDNQPLKKDDLRDAVEKIIDQMDEHEFNPDVKLVAQVIRARR